jgi:serine/threonine protein kinase
MTSQCSVTLLKSALSGNMSAEREQWLFRHLEECDACSTALERMAGGGAWCQEAAALLIGDDLDDTVPARDEWSPVDFIVEHLEPSDEPNVLGRLGGYDVLEIIGRGGMGIVLKGFDRELKRCVAVKVLSPHLAQSPLAKMRFAREARAAAAVVHPNVLAIHQVQSSGPLPFLVMPLVAGESLAQRLMAQGRLELKETLRIGMQAAAGLAAAHEQGIVHRDVKPANILLEKGVERAVLTDFGLARAADDVSLTRWGIIAGTPQYMSPEQARGEPLDGRSDLFSLGCVLYEMATGVSPFRADSTIATLRRLIDDPPPAMASLNPDLPPWFTGIVDRLLEKDPSRRFGSAKEVSGLLEGCLAHLQQPASVPLPEAIPAPAARRVSRLRKTLVKGTIAMIATLGIALLSIFSVQTTEPPDIAGNWSGEGWGQVVLRQTAAGDYAGTYGDTAGKQPGKIELKWSRIERRFNGTWREGEDRFGELSIRLADREIRGGLTTDLKSKINPATPRLADLVWTRIKLTTDRAEAQSGTAFERALSEFQSGDQIKITDVSGTSKDMESGSRPQTVTEAEHQLIQGEINRIVCDIKVFPNGEEAAPLELLKGPLLRYKAKPSFIYGTVWAWGGPGRPQAVFSLALCGSPDHPQWFQEIVTLSDKPLRAAMRDRTWWSTEMSGWDPKPIPSADAPAENREKRLQQMQRLALRFTGWGFDEIGRSWRFKLMREPIYRYTGQTASTLDGAIFALVGAVQNPEILLVIEAEKDVQGGAQWKFDAACMASSGLLVKLDGKESWRRTGLDNGAAKPSEPYYLRFISAEPENRRDEEKAKESEAAGRDPPAP